MIASATTTVTIYRGQTEDDWGDVVDNDTVAGSGISASIIEINEDATTETSGFPRVIRKAIGRVGSEVDVQTNDRIYDEKYQETWVIVSASRVKSPVCALDTKLDLKRTT
ncbi:hypothetical protein ACPYPG_08235 [Streptomyces sp. FR-108]|uniref:hypothetical protein n=1 Tax=Streptomyces sp. FR-108 TaxID=3416665 RepID=UPI003CE9EA6E